MSTTQERTWVASFSPDGSRLVVTDGKQARILDARTRQTIVTLAHAEVLHCASFDGDGWRLATGDTDGVVRVWNVTTGAVLQEYHARRADGTTPTFSVVAFSPDGTLIAANSGSDAWAWRLGGELVAELPHLHAEYEDVMKFSADGRWLAVSSRDEAHVYDTRSWELSAKLAIPGLIALDFDPHAARLATATVRGESSIWSIPAGERLHLLATGEPSRSIRYSPDGNLVASGGKRGTGWLWSARTGELVTAMNLHKDTITAIEFDKTSKQVLTASADATVAVFDVELGVPIARLAGPRNAISAAHFAPGSRAIVVVAWDGSAHLLDGAPSERVWWVPGLGRDCGGEDMTEPDSRFQALGCKVLGTRIWDTTEHHLLAELPGGTSLPGRAAASPVVSADGARAAIAIGHSVFVYRLPGGELDHEIVHTERVTSVAFATSGHTLVSGDERGAILRDRGDGSVVMLARSPGEITALVVLPDGRTVSADAERHLRIYDAQRGALLQDLALNTRVRRLRASRDSRRLITIPVSGYPEPPALWDVERGRVVAFLQTPSVFFFTAQFVQGDREIVTASNDGIPRLWDGVTGRLIRSYPGAGTMSMDATMSPDGTKIVTGAADGIVRFWDTATGVMLWTMQAHRAMVSGMHFDGDDLVTRSSTGELARWRFPKLASLAAIEPILACLPRRFDAETGGTIEQPPCPRDSGVGSFARE